MTATYDDFKRALDYLVSIEPDPSTYIEMEEYDVIMAPYEAEINKAHKTIRDYGAQIAGHGLGHMQSVLDGFLTEKSDPMAYAVIESTVNAHWHGLGEWRG